MKRLTALLTAALLLLSVNMSAATLMEDMEDCCHHSGRTFCCWAVMIGDWFDHGTEWPF